MGILFILLGLLAAGAVADFVVENHLATAPAQTFALFGGSFRLSEPQLVLWAAVLGALAFLFVILGVGLLRGSWGRRRALKRRIADLERENGELRSKLNLAAAAGSRPMAEARVDAGDRG